MTPMCVVELDPRGSELLGLERSDSEVAPALLAELALEEVRRPDRAVMRDRRP